ncbi:MAG: cation:proton antiporter [Gammaproteobacteria bacterium]|nr:cation:proton antiporter [Gammaproteobacteria bacterium]
MESILLSIDPRDPIWIAIAFLCGFAVKFIGLPPLVGFLFAGFLLNVLGAEAGEFLRATADLGITLLLFTIGLKLKPQSLAKPEVWGVASIHMIFITALLSVLALLLAKLNISIFAGLEFQSALLIGFVLSFSSTVFAIKILDELGATMSRHGRIAIGVLIVQDIAAVIFLAVSAGKVPSMWALALLLLFPLRHVLQKVLDHSGHGELLVLYGIVLALGGADIFELVGMKGDVGALVIGMLLANHSKSKEMAKALLSFKDLFLLGFFLSVGMTALPGWNELWIALIFIIFLPLKVALYFGLFSAFKLRASTSWRTSLNLANYSEFGLIVGILATTSGWLPQEWLSVFAIVLSISFIISAPLTSIRDHFYSQQRLLFKRFERRQRLSGEENLDIADIEAVIFGMGRVGSALYRSIEADFKDRIIGIEMDNDKTKTLQEKNINVINGDATNPDFWSRAPTLIKGLEWVLLTLPNHQANMAAAKQLKEMGYRGRIAATSKFADEEEQLKEIGVEFTFNIYAEAGTGFANDLKRRFKPS